MARRFQSERGLNGPHDPIAGPPDAAIGVGTDYSDIERSGGAADGRPSGLQRDQSGCHQYDRESLEGISQHWNYSQHGDSRPHHDGGMDRMGARSGDRKSTRLNSSHSQISYAVFCLKKKKKNKSEHKDEET